MFCHIIVNHSCRILVALLVCSSENFTVKLCHLKLLQMQNRIAIFCCNLKPAKMRGIMSEGMIMCGSSPDKVEIIEPPAGSVKGERVIVDGFPGIIYQVLDIYNLYFVR